MFNKSDPPYCEHTPTCKGSITTIESVCNIATTGTIDPGRVHYLGSRAVEAATATRPRLLIITALAVSLLDDELLVQRDFNCEACAISAYATCVSQVKHPLDKDS